MDKRTAEKKELERKERIEKQRMKAKQKREREKLLENQTARRKKALKPTSGWMPGILKVRIKSRILGKTPMMFGSSQGR